MRLAEKRRFILPPAGRAVLWAGLFLHAECGENPPQAAAVSLDPPAPILAAADTLTDELRSRLAALHQESQSLEAELSDARSAIDTAQAEVERLQQGLHKCVAKLHEVSAEASAAYVPVPGSSTRQGSRARVFMLSAPTVSAVGDSAAVTVRRWKVNNGDTAGDILITLLLDGGVIDSSSQYAGIGSRTDQGVTATLSTFGREEPFSARVRSDF